MTLDEFITYFEEQSKEHTNLVPFDVDEKYNNNCRQLAEWLRELKNFKVLFVKANRDVGNVHLDNRAIFEKFFWEVWKIFDVKGLEEVNVDADSNCMD